MSFINAKIVCKQANPEEYHKQAAPRGDKSLVVSSSMLRVFSQCPRRWKEGYESPDSDSKKFGSLLDCRLLTPESFKERFAIQPATYTNDKEETKPWNNNANVCKAWREEQVGKDIVSAYDVGKIDKARKRILSDDIIAAWCESSDCQVWVTADWKDEDSGLIISVKVLLDFVPKPDSEFYHCLGDLKCIRSAALTPFQRQVFQLGWHLQAALYQDVYVAATGEDRNTYCFVGVENYEPFEPFKRILSQDFVQIGRQSYQHALKRYAKCLETGIWQGYDDHKDAIQGWSLCAAEPWMEFAALEDALEVEQEKQTDNDDIIP
jgi:hypothetical protein